ncbi:hypothetical protein FRX31_031946 [Thalictrum thalictroides]|uniref:Uncharacterized protein n=1 Tax=Thalictrum thalictroides TaxID=46969 RepID=A0A7J6V0S6_THATH|nr:hypothetical protein FRX31_031946 [Thalictrum thalictroides]
MAILCSSLMSSTPLVNLATKHHISVNSLYKQTIFSSQLSIPFIQNRIRKSLITACLPLDGKPDYQQILHRPGPADFPRSPWGSQDFGLSSSFDSFAEEIKIADLKKEVKSMMLSLAMNNTYQELDMIDKLQRLGIALSLPRRD